MRLITPMSSSWRSCRDSRSGNGAIGIAATGGSQPYRHDRRLCRTLVVYPTHDAFSSARGPGAGVLIASRAHAKEMAGFRGIRQPVREPTATRPAEQERTALRRLRAIVHGNYQACRYFGGSNASVVFGRVVVGASAATPSRARACARVGNGRSPGNQAGFMIQ